MAARGFRIWVFVALAGLACTLVVGLLPGDASGGGRSNQFERWDPAEPSPTGQTVASECNPPETAEPETWPRAKARFRMTERAGRTQLSFVVRNAKPNTLYTVWVRLLGDDSEGNPYGGSPLTGIPVTPLVASDELPNQLAETLPNPGNPDPTNGFRTNRRGFGRLTISVDFPITSGAYPFQRFPNFAELKDDMALTNKANVDRLGGQPAAIRPVAITEASQAPATLLIASHCVDDLAHGLLPGPHENWFVWGLD